MISKNHILVYMYTFFYYLAKTVTSVFSAVLLYKMGFNFAQILLFIALMFGFMGLLSPLSPYLFSRIGVVKSSIISNLALILGSFLLLVNTKNASAYFLLTFIFLSLNGAIIHPIGHMIPALYVDSAKRGKINGIITIIKSLAVIISTALVSIYLHNNVILYTFIIVTLLLSLVPLKILFKNESYDRKYSLKEPFKNMFSSSFREYIPTFANQSFPIIEGTVLSLYIYVLVGDIKVFASIIIVASIVEIISIYVFGKITDKSSDRVFLTATSLRSLSSISMISLTFTPLLLFIVQSFYKLIDKLHTNIFSVLTQRVTKEHQDPIIFTTSKEMVLCFTEFIVLLLFSLTAIFIKEQIFVVIFLSSFMAVWVMYLKWR